MSQHHEHRGLGAALLQDMIARTAAVGREIGCRGLLVHAEPAGPRLLPAPDPGIRTLTDRRTAPGPAHEGHPPLAPPPRVLINQASHGSGGR